MKFLSADQLNSLADARDAYANLMTAYESAISENEAIRSDLQASGDLLAEVNAKFEEVKAEADKVAALSADLTKAQETVGSLEGELAKNKQALQAATQRVEQLESEAKSADQRAAAICASVGVDPLRLTPGGGEEADLKSSHKAALLAQFNAISDPAKKTAFFRQHRADLIGK